MIAFAPYFHGWRTGDATATEGSFGARRLSGASAEMLGTGRSAGRSESARKAFGSAASTDAAGAGRRRAAGAIVAAGAAALAAGLHAAPTLAGPPALLLNEIRTDQPGTDSDEYFELLGEPGASLDGVTFIVIGDGVGLSGCIEEIVSLDGHAIAEDGLLAVGQRSMTIGTPDVVTALEFENSDNLTFFLVTGFSGALGDDLDLDDDGVLDVTPWETLLDGVSCVESLATPPKGTEWWYATPVGPGGNGDPPYLIRRCPTDGAWTMGPNDPAAGVDTPGEPNAPCDSVECAADLNGDTVVDGDDLAVLLLNWGDFGSPEKGGGNPAADINGDGMVDGGDLGALLMAWQECVGKPSPPAPST